MLNKLYEYIEVKKSRFERRYNADNFSVGFFILDVAIILMLLCYIYLGSIGLGIERFWQSYLNKLCKERIETRAEELATLRTQHEVEMLARKYTDRLFEREPMFSIPGEVVKGNPNPVFLKMPGEFVERTMLVEATAYWTHDPEEASGDGIAYDGTPAVAYKTIAVDPKVIPLQAEVYIPTIGWCRANDTGNAIKGRIIDIAMPNRAEAWKWGRQLVQVRIRVKRK